MLRDSPALLEIRSASARNRRPWAAEHDDAQSTRTVG